MLENGLENLFLEASQPIEPEPVPSSTKTTNTESLRWEYELEEPRAEQARIELYKSNRRKRYLEQRARLYSIAIRFELDLSDDDDNDDEDNDEEEDDVVADSIGIVINNRQKRVDDSAISSSLSSNSPYNL